MDVDTVARHSPYKRSRRSTMRRRVRHRAVGRALSFSPKRKLKQVAPLTRVEKPQRRFSPIVSDRQAPRETPTAVGRLRAVRFRAPTMSEDAW